MLWPFPGDPRHNSTSYEETNLSNHSTVMLPSRQNTRAAFLHLQLTSIISRHHGPPSAVMGHHGTKHQAQQDPPPSLPMPSIFIGFAGGGYLPPSIPVPVPVPPFPVSQPPSLCGWNVSADGSAAGHAIVWENKKKHASISRQLQILGKRRTLNRAWSRLSLGSLTAPPPSPSHPPPCLADLVSSPSPVPPPSTPLRPPPCHPLGDSAELLS